MYEMTNETVMTPDHKVLLELVKVTDMFKPVLDVCEGFKKEMENRGWSPTMAEQSAGLMLNGFIMKAFQG